METVNFLGIDPGESAMGWGVVQVKEGKLDYFTSAKNTQTLPNFIKLLDIYQPAGVGVELVGKWKSKRKQNKNLVGLLHTAEWGGRFVGYASGKGYRVYAEAANSRVVEGEWDKDSWRKKLTGVSFPDAVDVLEALRRKLPNFPERLYQPSYEDERDALGIAVVTAIQMLPNLAKDASF